MPVAITKYTCAFKCGAKAMAKESHMAGHEKKCWNNPETKTCKTCKNEIYEDSSRGCKIPELDSVMESNEDILKGRQTFHIRPIHQCEYWNKSRDKNTIDFANILDTELKNKGTDQSKHFPYFND